MTPRLPPALDLKVVRQPISALRLEGRAARTHSEKQMCRAHGE
jgi:hypothetical protein